MLQQYSLEKVMDAALPSYQPRPVHLSSLPSSLFSRMHFFPHFQLFSFLWPLFELFPFISFFNLHKKHSSIVLSIGLITFLTVYIEMYSAFSLYREVSKRFVSFIVSVNTIRVGSEVEAESKVLLESW